MLEATGEIMAYVWECQAMFRLLAPALTHKAVYVRRAKSGLSETVATFQKIEQLLWVHTCVGRLTGREDLIENDAVGPYVAHGAEFCLRK